MIGALAPLIDDGRVKVYCADGADAWTWRADDVPLEERARRHGEYERWITDTVAPFIHDDSRRRHHRHGHELRRVPRGELHAEARRPLPARDLHERRVRRLGRRLGRARRRRLLQQPDGLRAAPRGRPPRLASLARVARCSSAGRGSGRTRRARSSRRSGSRHCSARRAFRTSSTSGDTTCRTTGRRGARRSRIICPALSDDTADRPAARHRGGLARRVRGARLAARAGRRARRSRPSASSTSRSTCARSRATRSSSTGSRGGTTCRASG